MLLMRKRMRRMGMRMTRMMSAAAGTMLKGMAET
jgi:hypothetical protein